MGTIAETCRGLNQTRIQTLAPATRPVATALLLLLADAVALLMAGCLGVECWNLVNSAVGVEFYLRLWPSLGVFLLAYASLGLYPAVGMSPVEELRRTVLGATVVYLVSAVSIFLSKDLGTYSRGVFLSSWACSIILVPSSRALVRQLFAAKPWWGVSVLVFGAAEAARMVIARLQAQPELGLKLVACLDDDTQETTCSGLPVAGPLSAAPELSRMLRIRHALIAMPRLKRQELISLLERMSTTFTHVIVVPDLFGIASLWISAKDLGGVLGLEVKQNLLVPVNRWLKRGLDLVVASAAGIVALPIVGVAVLWIKRVSPGPAFYIQEREGECGSTIRVRKLRTMHFDAETMLLQFLANDPDARQEWERYFKLKRDPRVLPGIGHILRRTSLDELPQLWNVIKGEMSLVGPRPFPFYHLEQFDRNFRALRARVMPGLTGLWQVSARSDGDLSVQKTLDTYYIRNWSLWLDLHILARTARAVLFRQGAY